MRLDRIAAPVPIGDVLFGITGIRPRPSRPYPLGTLGGDGGGVVGMDSHPVDPEEVLAVRRDCLGLDGFHGPVPAGYGGRDPVLGDHEARCRA